MNNQKKAITIFHKVKKILESIIDFLINLKIYLCYDNFLHAAFIYQKLNIYEVKYL